MLGRTLKMAFWVVYDHLGKLILASLVWSFMTVAPLMLAFVALAMIPALAGVVAALVLTVIGLCVTLPVATTGLAHMTKELIETHDGSLATLFKGMALYGRRAAGIGLLLGFAAVSLMVSVWFYATRFQADAPWLGYALAGLALWCLLFATLMALFAAPTLVQKKDNILGTLRLEAMLILGNPVFTAGVGLQVLALTAIAVVVPPLFVFLYGGLLAAITSSAYELLARKYAQTDIENDEYLTRGLRDMLFPWKG